MDAQPEPVQGSTEPKKTREQATRRTTSALETTPGNIKGVVIARNDMMSDNVHGGVYISKQTAAPHPPKRPTDILPEQPEQANIQQREGSRWDELPARVDALWAEMKNVQSALRKLQQEKHEKTVLQKKLEMTQDKLQKNTVALSGLQQSNHDRKALQMELQQTQDRLRKTTADLEEVRKKWKKATSQLDQLRSQGTVLYQLSDSDLTESVMQLRHNIRGFSLQYFAGKLSGQPANLPAGDFWKYMQETTPGSDDYRTLLMSETRGPIVIQSFLWRLLASEIFENFCWAPRLKSSITQVYQVLQPITFDDEIAPETERRFQMWKATTSALILESMKHDDQVGFQNLAEDFSSHFSKQVLNVLNPFVRNLDKGILNDLRHIIKESIALDLEICRQAARIDWIFPHSGDSFDPNCMAAEMGEVIPEPGKYVSMAITPALKKQGRSTGDNFETEYLLLNMGVTCVPLSPGPYSIKRGPGRV